jgi:dihydrofolate synthase/folylpolyglutamate synthase
VANRTLSDWLTYLESLHPKTIALGLERVAVVKKRLKLDPKFPLIIVGGTNGKGSVCAMLEAILHAAGYRVGCYTSPHLLRYNERVRIAKREVDDAALCASFAAIEVARSANAVVDRDLSRHIKQVEINPDLQIPLTYFEFGTLAAMQCFIAQNVDVAILEVGLGGRLDAVNVFDAECAVVTSIDIDHVDYLGDTREKIAYEKAGIFRKNKVAIFGDSDMPVAIASEAQRIGAPLHKLGEQFGYKTSLQQWNFIGEHPRHALPIPALRGAYQLNNASTALAALEAVKAQLPVSMEAVRRGLTEVTLAARFQMVPGKPTLILDVAHNPHAARSFAKNLASMPPCPQTFAVIAMLKDKDMAGVVAALKPVIDVWLVAGIDAPRGATANELAEVLRANGITEIYCFANASEALHHAYNQAGDDDRIAALGSFYTVAEVMRARGLSGA